MFYVLFEKSWTQNVSVNVDSCHTFVLTIWNSILYIPVKKLWQPIICYVNIPSIDTFVNNKFCCWRAVFTSRVCVLLPTYIGALGEIEWELICELLCTMHCIWCTLHSGIECIVFDAQYILFNHQYIWWFKDALP